MVFNLNNCKTRPEKELTLLQMKGMISEISDDMSSKYIEYLAYLLSLVQMGKDAEFGFLTVISSLYLCETHKKMQLPVGTALKRTQQVHNSLSNYLNKGKSVPISATLQKSIRSLLILQKNQISTNTSQYSPTNRYKISILSLILQEAPDTPMSLSLLSQSNLITLPLTSSLFPLYTSNTAPFLPIYPHKSHTLVLDLDETLVHNKNNEFLIRPGASDFLSELSLHYEIVLFTAASPMHADLAMRIIDPQGKVKLRLYKNHIRELNGKIQKNLDLLGRDLSNVIIVDNIGKNFEMHQENGICIETWIGDMNDNKLGILGEALKKIPYCKESVREILVKVRKYCI